MEDEQPAREANKICGVCGDRALGHNFNAVSCESCKAFFRRNALKNKDFRCPFTENCNITPVTRRFCQKCRLDKCFAIGMRKDYIMSEEDKVLKRQKIEQNRAKKRPRCENGRPSKSRRTCEEDCEDTAVSVNSVASNDAYFWESDRKYADLDANRQSVTESMSPVTGASVPSPSSPPESANIAGSKTLDMLKESSGGGSSVSKYEETGRDARIDEINMVDSNSRYSTLGNQSKYSPEYETAPSYARFVQSPVESSSYAIEHATRAKHPEGTSTTSTTTMVCQKPKETCPKENNVISKFMHDPDLVIKLASNPNLVAKLFQDQSLMLKIITDPEVADKLEKDPQIVQFLEENGAMSDKEVQNSENNTEEEEEEEDDVLSPEDSKDTFRTKQQSYIENPILTDLIANSNPEERSSQHREFSNTGGDWNKNVVTDVTRDVLQDVQRIPIVANSIESILCEAIKLEFSAYSALGGMQTRRELNDAERAKLNELIVANKALLAPLDEDITNLVGEECKIKSDFGKSDPVLLDVINLTAIAIRRLIKMAKKINAFKNMCQEDQIALLKGGCTEMMILRSAVNYDPERDMWRIPHTRESMSNIKADILKEAKGNLYAEHARFVGTFDPRWRDENIILILSAIALFTPDRPKVVHNDVIKLEQNSYYYLLRRYLESVYPGCEAKSMFLKLIQKISDLHRLNNEVVGVYLNVNPSCVEPLLIEIFDLKH